MADEKKRGGPFGKTRGGQPLTREEIREIKKGRKKLRAELRRVGEHGRKDFETTASSMGLYFDKHKSRAMIAWFFSANGAWILLATALVLTAAIAGFALLAEMQGHFTISMSEEMFREGFIISEDEGFETSTSHLFATPAVNVPCISIVDIPENVDDMMGEHNGNYFAYTFYLRNEGQSLADYVWEIRLRSDSVVSSAAWLMVFVDGEMTIYAKANADGTPAALPAQGVTDYGYLDPPLYEHAADKSQYEIVDKIDALTYWRVVPKPFFSEDIVAAGRREDTMVGEVHKYTVVVWIEGDDPDCTNELIGKHVGFEMYMQMVHEEEEE